MKDFESMGQRILTQRTKSGLTQFDVASRCGLYNKQIYEYEKGLFFPNSHTLRRLCIALECSADYLLGIKDEP